MNYSLYNQTLTQTSKHLNLCAISLLTFAEILCRIYTYCFPWVYVFPLPRMFSTLFHSAALCSKVTAMGYFFPDHSFPPYPCLVSGACIGASYIMVSRALNSYHYLWTHWLSYLAIVYLLSILLTEGEGMCFSTQGPTQIWHERSIKEHMETLKSEIRIYALLQQQK